MGPALDLSSPKSLIRYLLLDIGSLHRSMVGEFNSGLFRSDIIFTLIELNSLNSTCPMKLRKNKMYSFLRSKSYSRLQFHVGNV
jgi:hypothetical protein